MAWGWCHDPETVQTASTLMCTFHANMTHLRERQWIPVVGLEVLVHSTIEILVARLLLELRIIIIITTSQNDEKKNIGLMYQNTDHLLYSPSSYFAERNRICGTVLFPYWGLFKLLHQPLYVRYFEVWSQGSVLASASWHWEMESVLRRSDWTTVDTTRVTSMLVNPSAKSSMLTFNLFPPFIWRLILVLPGLRKYTVVKYKWKSRDIRKFYLWENV